MVRDLDSGFRSPRPFASLKPDSHARFCSRSVRGPRIARDYAKSYPRGTQVMHPQLKRDTKLLCGAGATQRCRQEHQCDVPNAWSHEIRDYVQQALKSACPIVHSSEPATAVGQM